MIEEGWDVNEEFEKLFGSPKRVNLFDTEKEYNELRQYIMSEPQVTSLNNELPFDGVEISSTNDYIHHESNTIKDSVIGDVLVALIRKRQVFINPDKKKVSIEDDKHLFFIKESGVCDAKGYYDEVQKYFYICKDSLVSLDTDIIYKTIDKENAREKFLSKICKEDNGYYRVIRDAKCRSASAAACYVLGYESDQNSWKDSDGKTLYEIYPAIFSLPIKERIVEQVKNARVEKTKIKKAQSIQAPRYYYISREGIGERSCNARGEYDKVNNKFVILAGSELAHEVTASYKYSASDIKRKKFIQQYCGLTRSANGYISSDFKLEKDGVCNSPEEAACFVLGEFVNGCEVWISKDGIPLEINISKM